MSPLALPPISASDINAADLLTPISNQARQQIDTQRQTLPTSTGLTQAQAQTKTVRLELSIASLLKSKLFGKKIALTNQNFEIKEYGIVIGVEKDQDLFYLYMHDASGRATFRAKVIFEKEIRGSTFRDDSYSNTITGQVNLDMHTRLNSSIGPLLDQTDNTNTASAIPQFTNESVTTIGENATYFDRKDSTLKTTTLIVYKNRLYFKDDGIQVLMRAERETKE